MQVADDAGATVLLPGVDYEVISRASRSGVRS